MASLVGRTGEAEPNLRPLYDSAKKDKSVKKIRCKFKCNSVTKRTGWGGAAFVYDASFGIVHDGSEENKQFFASTPTGDIKVGTVRDDAFVVGQAYYVDFTPAD